ncbi:MAG: siderophore-interacting protein [Pseudomonadota bacterium]
MQTLDPTKTQEKTPPALVRVLERLNGEFSDSLLLIVRYGCGVSEATDAFAVGATPERLELAVRVGASTLVRCDAPLLSIAPRWQALENEVLRLVFAARDRAPQDYPLTRWESQLARTQALRVNTARVAARQQLTERLFQLTLTGDFSTFRSPGFDAAVYLYTPRNGDLSFLNRPFSMADYREMAVDQRPAGGYFSIRNARPNELDIWFAVHPGTADPNTVSGWARHAEVGDALAFWGPRSAFSAPEITEQLLLIADESALAACLGVLRSLPDLPSRLLLQCAADAEPGQLRALVPAPVRLTLCPRAAADDEDALLDRLAIQAVDPATTFVFGGGEAAQMAALRRVLTQIHGLADAQIQLQSYWRRGPVGLRFGKQRTD